MTRPSRYLLRMVLFLSAVGVAVGVLFRPLLDAFLSNTALNGMIVAAFLIGVIYIFRQVMMLAPEVKWLESFRQNKQPLSGSESPRLLAPMAAMMGENPTHRFKISALSMRSLLDGIGARLDESRDIARYTVGLLIFLGLLGTFWGLLQTIGAVRDVIAGLGIGLGGDMTAVFSDLKSGLQAPLGGMRTAFSSSLFGLSGALVLGFLDLQAGQAQNRFFNDLEDWLSGQARLQTSTINIEGEGGVPAYVQALLEQTADSLENLQRTLVAGEQSRQAADGRLVQLAENIERLTDVMTTQQDLMKKMADGTQGGLDEASRTHIRNIDVYLARLLEETAQGRDQMIQQVRSEIKMLARTIAAKDKD